MAWNPAFLTLQKRRDMGEVPVPHGRPMPSVQGGHWQRLGPTEKAPGWGVSGPREATLRMGSVAEPRIRLSGDLEKVVYNEGSPAVRSDYWDHEKQAYVPSERARDMKGLRLRGFGSLGQWWNPVSWVQTGYNALTNVNNAANDVQSAISTVEGDLTLVHQDLQIAYGYILGLWADFSNYHQDFQTALNNLTNYLTGAGATMEQIGSDVAATAKGMLNLLDTINQQINTLVEMGRGIGNTLVANAQAQAAQWKEYMAAFAEAFSNLQQTQKVISDDLHMLRSHFDNYSSLVVGLMDEIGKEMDTVPNVYLLNQPALPSASSLKLPGTAGFGRMGYVPTPTGGRVPTAAQTGSGGGVTQQSQQAAAAQYGQQTAQQQQQQAAASGKAPPGPISAPAGSSPAYQAFVGGYNSQVSNAQARSAAAEGPGKNVPSPSSYHDIVSAAQATPVHKGGPTASMVAPYAVQASPYPAKGVSAIAKAVRLMAQTGVVAANVEDALVSLTTLHATTLPAMVSQLQTQNATLQNIHNALQAQNALLSGGSGTGAPTSSSTKLPATGRVEWAGPGMGSWDGNQSLLGLKLRAALGEAVYIVKGGR